MVSLGEPEVRDVSVESTSLPDTELPKNNQALFEEIRDDPDVQTPDMQVEGDWTYGAIADRISMEERVNNNLIRWKSFKKVDWGGFDAKNQENILLQANGTQKDIKSPQSVPINTLVPQGEPNAFINLGSPAPDAKSSFASGDPGLGVPAGNGYMMDGRGGNSSTAVHNGNVVLTASEGTRAVAFNPPGDAQLLQMINLRDWGHQARAVLEALLGMAGLGSDSAFKVPAFNTVGPTIAMVAPFQYSLSRVMGAALMQATFDMKMPNSTTVSFTLRQPSGKKIVSTNVDVPGGDQRVKINFINVPPSGIVSLDSGNTPYTVANTEIFPPI